MTKTINLTLKVWRQKGPKDKGRFDTYHAENISTDMSFLEMLDVVNDQLTIDDKEPIAFDHDCRRPICRIALAPPGIGVGLRRWRDGNSGNVGGGATTGRRGHGRAGRPWTGSRVAGRSPWL